MLLGGGTIKHNYHKNENFLLEFLIKNLIQPASGWADGGRSPRPKTVGIRLPWPWAAGSRPPDLAAQGLGGGPAALTTVPTMGGRDLAAHGLGGWDQAVGPGRPGFFRPLTGQLGLGRLWPGWPTAVSRPLKVFFLIWQVGVFQIIRIFFPFLVIRPDFPTTW